MKADLAGWRLGRAIYVVDSGFSGRDNLRRLRSGGGHYIAGVKLRSGMPETEQALSRQGRYRQVRDNLRVKEVRVGDGDAAVRYVVCHNPAEAERDRAPPPAAARADRGRARPARRAAPAGEDEGRAGGAPARRVRAARPPDPLPLPAPDARAAGSRSTGAKIAAEERLDGKYLLTTSDPSLSAEDVALGYKQLLEAERSFRDLKGTLLLRPVFHRKDDRIRAHVLICFLALVLVRLAETRTGETWRTIRAELGQIRHGHFRSARRRLHPDQRAHRPPARPPHRPRRPRAAPLRPHHPRRDAPSRRRHTPRKPRNSRNPAAHAGSRAPGAPTSCGTRVRLSFVEFVGFRGLRSDQAG